MKIKLATITLLCTSNFLFAQENIVKQIGIQQDRQQRDDTRNRDTFPLKPKNKVVIESIKDIKKIETNSKCFTVKETILKSDEKLIPSFNLYGKFNNKCIDINDIQMLLTEINKFYQNNNLITTRAYVPKQNLNKGVLNLVVKAGTLNGYAYLDGSNVDYRLLNAFAIDIGETINLRELEQGVDNFNRLQSQKGKMKLVPATNQGESYLVMEQQQTKPWNIKIGIDNSGYETTGKYKGLTSFSYDNLLNLNDNVNIDFNTNLDDSNHSKRAKSGSLNYSIPYGKWLYSYTHSRHIFNRIIQGVNQQYYVNGYSDSDTLGINRLLYRGQTARVNFYTNLAIKDSKNYIEHFEIETQRRNLTILDFGIFGDDVIGNANISYDFGTKLGLNILNGMEDIPGDAQSKTKTLHSKISSKIPFLNGKYTYNTTLAGQYTDNELSGSEQFGVGGRNDVRGFHEDNLYGNSGLYFRNEIETMPYAYGSLKNKYFLGIDFGAVKESSTATWSDRKLSGISTGTRFELTKYVSGDLTISKAIKRPEEFESSKEQIYFNINFIF